MSIKQKVKHFIDSGARPVINNRNKDSVLLRQSKAFVRLTNDAGPTPAGLFWQELTGEQLPQSGSMSQTAVREGNIEYMKVNGKRAITRRLNVATGEWVP